ncbi:MAG: glycosyltransferase family 2 protein [Microbacterium sp.]|uniref:glycosyltransferase family 2 protein n=1 Tax=Microbacterium TaxID=33882 RepID=UPI001D17AD61|nr:glycosyltransferase family 2 protein [Microbacterium schleiferi]MCC4267059.1 glycosyltransferase family 2 protein [Microbacterium schleiferi]
MKIVMTMMVRDEADIIEAVLEHHRRQGVDHILVTDNGSVDGTREALERFAQSGFVTVWDDPVHRKQQSETVTRMARLAATEYGADWVINADADEFFVAADEASTLRDELRRIDEAVQYVTVQVVNLTGAPAVDGTGLQRLIYRDRRSAQRLVSAGIPFHPTGDAIHRGHAEVSVSQGNHFVSAPNWGDPVPEPRIEVLHLPWRSWAQYERKVRNTGESYRANPDLEPSPRHHGMQDFRRLEQGRLEETYVAKHPLPDEIAELAYVGELVEDRRLAHLAEQTPELVVRDLLYVSDRQAQLARDGRRFTAIEAEYERRLQDLRDSLESVHGSLHVAMLAVAEGKTHIDQRDEQIADLRRQLDAAHRRFAVRLANRLSKYLAPVRGAGRGRDAIGRQAD